VKGTRIYSKSAIEEKARYARAAVCGDWIIVSGTMGQDPATGQLPEHFEDQLRNSFATIEAALSEAGASLADVVRCGVFLVRREDTPALVAILAEKFQDTRPANTTVICDLPVPEALVEVEVTAYAGGT
jgi:enamine deaminase RidA (YjgF/YER057c/UK114 family)